MNDHEPSAEDLIAEDRVQGDYFFHRPQSEWKEPLAVVCCGRERCLAGYRVERASFPYFAIEYVTAGEGRLRLGELDLPLRPGSLFVYGPHVHHRLETCGDGLIKYFVDFAGTRARAMLEEQALGPGGFQMLGERRWARDIFDQLIACASLPRPKAGVLAPRLLELLLLRVSEDAHVQPSTVGSAAAETFSRCREHVREHYTRISKVEEAAEACGVSVAYFVRLFQRHSRESAYQFLTRLKMEHAADLLLRRFLSVKEVAAAVGYGDPYHFSRAFKRYHGTAPKHFRENFHRLPSTAGRVRARPEPGASD